MLFVFQYTKGKALQLTSFIPPIVTLYYFIVVDLVNPMKLNTNLNNFYCHSVPVFIYLNKPLLMLDIRKKLIYNFTFFIASC